MRQPPRFTGLLLAAAVAAGCGDQATQPLGIDGAFAPAFANARGSGATPWLASGPGTVTLLSDGVGTDAAMRYYLDHVFTLQTWEFSTTATRARTAALPFSYDGFHPGVSESLVFVEFFHTTGSGTTTTPLISQEPEGNFDLNGSVTATVRPGDVYGFRFGGRAEQGRGDRFLFGEFTVDLPEHSCSGRGCPQTKDDCQNGGWEAYGFRNQGQCVRLIETGKDSR